MALRAQGCPLAQLSELSRHFESPDDDRPRRPEDRPRDLDDVFDPEVGVVDRVARAMRDDQSLASPRSPVSFDRANVVDRLAGPADGRLALERLCNDLGRDLHDTVSQKTWDAADQAKRAELAQQVQAQVGDRYGLGESELTVSSELDEETLGECTAGNVIVSERLLSEPTPHELIDTIAHENEHALQEEITSGRKAHPLGEFAAAEVKAWREGERTYDPQDYMGKGYSYNPLEVDSRHAGVLVVEGYLKAEIAQQTKDIAAQTKDIKALKDHIKAQDDQTEALKDHIKAQDEQIKTLKELVEKLAAGRDPGS